MRVRESLDSRSRISPLESRIRPLESIPRPEACNERSPRGDARSPLGVGRFMKPRKTIERTADGHHVVIDGRRWRATNPDLPEAERKRLVSELMRARSAVGRALKAGDSAAGRAARAGVHAAKVALGERGPKWWDAGGSKG